MSEGISVEGTKVAAKSPDFEVSTSCNFGVCILVLICIVMCCMFSMCLTAAVFAQAPGLGKKKRALKALKKKSLERKKRSYERRS